MGVTGDKDSGAWKRKYFDTLEDIERKEKTWAEMENLLKKTITRLSLAADGIDTRLDKQLIELREAIRLKSSEARLRHVVEALSDTLVQLDEQKSAHAAQPSLAQRLVQIVEKVPVPRGMNADAKQTIKFLQKQNDVESVDDLVEVVCDYFKKIVHATDDQDQHPLTRDDRKEGFFGRIFGANKDQKADGDGQELHDPQAPAAREHAASNTSVADQMQADLGEPGGEAELPVNSAPMSHEPDPAHPEDQPTNAAPEPVPLSNVFESFVDKLHLKGDAGRRLGPIRRRLVSIDKSDELVILTDELAKLLSEAYQNELGNSDNGFSETPSLSEVLIELLERLSLPLELNEQVETIKSKLEAGVADDEWDKVLRDIALVISEMRVRVQRERRELEEFLKQLTDRLNHVNERIHGVRDLQGQSFQSGNDFGRMVQNSVEDLQASVRDADDLGTLKSQVLEQLDTIVTHLEGHGQKSAEQHAIMEQTMTALNDRLRELEREGEALTNRLKEERNQALVDALTGIANRLAYDERITAEYTRWKRFRQPLSLLVWDVDFFKRVNDTYGHKAGDKVLKVVAERLSSQVRETDFFARYGGEEFVMLMPGTAAAAAIEVADKLRASIESTEFHYRQQRVNITLSCGVSEFQPNDTPERVFERADSALYRAKELGRNRCEMDRVGSY